LCFFFFFLVGWWWVCFLGGGFLFSLLPSKHCQLCFSRFKSLSFLPLKPPACCFFGRPLSFLGPRRMLCPLVRPFPRNLPPTFREFFLSDLSIDHSKDCLFLIDLFGCSPSPERFVLLPVFPNILESPQSPQGVSGLLVCVFFFCVFGFGVLFGVGFWSPTRPRNVWHWQSQGYLAL